jgi:hypothetical protein
MKNSFKKIISLSTLILVFINPVLIFANEITILNAPPRAIVVPEEPFNPSNQNLSPEFVNAQIQNSVLSTTANTSRAQTNSTVGSNVTGIASCLGSQIISQAIVEAVTGFAGTVASKATDIIFNVPVSEQGSVGASIKTEASARVGGGLSLFGFSIPGLPSWDSMGYCIVNTMIIYIADSTIEWVNTGFEGNPAFLNNPDQFFKDLANQEKIAFLQGLAYGINSSVCGVYKSTVLSAILSRYGKNQQNYGQQGYENGGYGYGSQGGPQNSCAFDQNPGQLNLFLRGDFSEGGGWNTWFELTQNPVNNPYDTYFNSVDRMNEQVEAVRVSKNTELTWNDGYLSFRKCENGEKNTNNCPITTPGTVVQSQLEKTLNLGKDRLVLADKFDQVVTAVVDQLITTALDKTLSTINNTVNDALSGGSNNSNQNLWNSGTVNPFYDPTATTTTSNTNSNTNSTSTTGTSTSSTSTSTSTSTQQSLR